MGTRVAGKNSRADAYPLPSDSGSGGGSVGADAEQATNAGPVTLTGTPQTVVGAAAVILAGPSGKISATFSGDVTFVNGNDTAEIVFAIDGTPIAESALDTQASTPLGAETLTQPISRTWLFTGLTPGTAHSIDAQMTSTGDGDTATNNALVISTF